MKAKKIITITITVLASLLPVFSGIMKLSQNPEMVKTLSKFGVEGYLVPLGLMEIGFTALFVYPKTMKIGFLLLTCYFAGAIATELSHGTAFNAVLPLVLIWIATFLRDSSVFLPGKAAVAN